MAANIQLHIPEPCHENWDNMTPADKGRFCGSCQKEVVDFSVMTDREMAQFFKKPLGGSVCGHFSNTQLDRDIALPKKRIPWVKYFFHVTIPAFLISMKSNAQTRGKVDVTVCIPERPMMGAVAYVETPAIFKGVVVNEKGDPLPFAAIKIKSTGEQVLSDINGVFKIKTPPNKAPEQLTVMFVAHPTAVVFISAADWQRGNITVTLNSMDMMVDGMIMPVKRIPGKPTIIDTVKNLFTASKISPSPVDQGNAFVVEWKCKIAEKIYVRVTGANDKVMLFVPFDAVKGNNRVPVNTDANWIPGKYTVQLLAINGKQLMVERVAVRLQQTDAVEKISSDRKPKEFPGINPVPKDRHMLTPMIAGGVSVVVKEEKNWIADTIKTIFPVFTASKISPNPLAQGQTFMIDWKSKTEEKIYIKITGIDGKELMSIPVAVSKGNNRLPVNTDTNWLPGTYVVNLFDAKGKKLLSEKIVIQ